MKRRITTILLAFACLCWTVFAPIAYASTVNVNIDYAFTSDNVVSLFSILDSSGGTIWSTNLSGDTDWTTAITGTTSISLQSNSLYTLQWDIVNLPKSSSNPYENNPMAFVGDIFIDGFQYLSSGSSVWQVDSHAPTVFGTLEGTERWNAGIESLLNDISPNAYWIGLGDPDKWGEGYSEMTVTASFMAPVPLPGAAMLLGSALLGLVGFRRTRLV